jgi:hypothetical protein
VWKTKDVSLFLSNPVIVGDTLFGLSERASGQFFALDAKTGRVLWLGPPREATNTAVVKAGSPLSSERRSGADCGTEQPDRIRAAERYTVSDSATWASRPSRVIGSSSKT